MQGNGSRFWADGSAIGMANNLSSRSGGPRWALPAAVLGAAALVAGVCGAQTAPQPLPYYHTIFAGTGSSYTPTLQTGSNATMVHGSAPGDGGPATSAQLNGPDALATDSIGNVYIIDSAGTVRRVDPTGTITTFAGGLAQGGSTNFLCPTGTDAQGDGCPANETYMNAAHGIAIDPATGDIYIAEATGDRIRKISHSTYMMTTVAGTGKKGSVDGDLVICSSISGASCSGTLGQVNGPRGMAVDKHGNLYVADTSNSAVRLLNFTTGKMTTIVNTTFTKASTTTCTTAATATTAGAANTGSIQDVAFDNQDNLYFADATCNYVYKVSEDPATKMVDSGSALTVMLGNGQSTPAQTVFANVLATQATITPASVRVDAQGNLYVGESTGSHVWFWDAATQTMHTLFGGSGPGNCYGAAGSGTAPYNGCDGPDSSASSTAGTPGLALDAWGNLYIADPASFYVHKLSLGTDAPAPTVPAGNADALLRFYGVTAAPTVKVDLTAAPDFSLSQSGGCVSSGGASTQDCGFIVATKNASTSAQYERAVVSVTGGGSGSVPLTNQSAPVCQAPVAASQTVQISASTAVPLSFQPGIGCSGTEAVIDSPHKYTYTVASGPTNGTLSGSAPSLTYTPNAGTPASDSFTFTVTDNNTLAGKTVVYDNGAASIVLEAPSPTTSAAATVTLQSYTTPIATPQSVSVNYNTATVITLAGTDSNAAALTYSIVTPPANGTLSAMTGNTVTYTPSSNYTGADSFTFKVNDTVSDSAPATVALTVKGPLPTAPVAASQTLTAAYQTALPVTLSATGTATITYAVATQAAHGTLSGTAPNLVYSPANGYSGPDSFTFTATNSVGSSTGTISITVALQPPVAQSQAVAVPFGTATPVTLVASGGGTLTYSVVSAPAHGAVALAGAAATYTPNTGFTGADSFTFKANNGSDSNIATVSITVNPAAPTATGQTVTVPFNAATSVTLVAQGTGTLTYQVVTQPAHGALSGTGSALTYTPSSGYAGSDSFTFTATNAGGISNTATVSVTVQQGLAWSAASGGGVTATVSAGRTATYKLQIAGWTGATGTVNFTCSGAAVLCTVSPNPATLNGATQIPVTVNVSTTTMPPSTASIGAWPNGSWLLRAMLAFGVCALLLPLRKHKTIVLACIALFAVIGFSGCSNVPQQPFGTAKGTYTLNVTATSGTVSATQPITLIVQ